MYHTVDTEIERLLLSEAPVDHINTSLQDHITSVRAADSQMFVELPYVHKHIGAVMKHVPVVEPIKYFVTQENLDSGESNVVPIHSPFNYHNRRLPLNSAVIVVPTDEAEHETQQALFNVQPTDSSTAVSVLFGRKDIISSKGEVLLKFSIR